MHTRKGANVPTLFTHQPHCPKSHENVRNANPNTLLNRNLLNRAGFHFFAEPWLKRAKTSADNQEWFEALIYLWVTFNAWLSLAVTRRELSDQDSYLWRVAGLDPSLSKSFTGEIEKHGDFENWVLEFHSLWPVFKSRTLLDNNIQAWQPWNDHSESRAQYRVRCFSTRLDYSDFAPSCFLEHQANSSQLEPDVVPHDWQHVLASIYQVRCNLFHGGKSFTSSSDQNFVRLSYLILASVLHGEWK